MNFDAYRKGLEIRKARVDRLTAAVADEQEKLAARKAELEMAKDRLQDWRMQPVRPYPTHTIQKGGV